MSIVWIVTTGNSDFKLAKKDGFLHLRTEKNSDLKPCQTKFPELIQGDDKLFSLPARVMGAIYSDAWETHKEIFRFPLLETFTKKLKNEGKHPDRIIVLLTNQEKIFLEDSNDSRYDRAEDSPYWRDTSRLEPIFKNYFDREFGKGKVQFPFPILEPETRQKGLDNWDSTLKLVQEEFEKWKISENDCVIVSHQASTPAISSAVQFVSLAKLGNKVDFLIANERDPDLTRFLEGSEYLKGIRIQEAKALLNSYNYAGVEALIKDYIQENKDIETLLNAAIQWNFAKFEDFAKHLVNYADEALAKQAEAYLQDPNQYWWWTAYEAAYLGVVRLKQGNTVEAMFHSFRAFEVLTIKYVERHSISGRFSRKAFKCLRHRKQAEWNCHPYIGELIDLNASEDQRNDLLDKRNNLFHQLRGFKPDDLFDAWDADETNWQGKVLGCLNFVSDQTFEYLDKEGSDGKVASLMAKVHEKLIDSL